MVKRGTLNVPVTGVAKSPWNLDQFRARAYDGVKKHDDVQTNVVGGPNSAQRGLIPCFRLGTLVRFFRRAWRKDKCSAALTNGTSLP